MKRYTVTWHEPAEGQLAKIWLAAEDRAAVRWAADRIETELAMRPAECGTLVAPGIRELVVPPLMALYVVREEDRIVEVAGVYRIPLETE